MKTIQENYRKQLTFIVLHTHMLLLVIDSANNLFNVLTDLTVCDVTSQF